MQWCGHWTACFVLQIQHEVCHSALSIKPPEYVRKELLSERLEANKGLVASRGPKGVSVSGKL